MGTPFMAAACSANCARSRAISPSNSASAEGRLPFHLGGQRAERGRDVAGQLDLRPVVPVDVRADGVDVDEVTRASPVPEAGFVFDRVVPDGDDHVGRVQEPVGGLVVEQADPAAEAVEEFSRHDPGPLVGAHDGQLRSGQESAHGFRGAGLTGEQAEQQEGLLRAVDQGRGCSDRLGVRGAEPSPVRPG